MVALEVLLAQLQASLARIPRLNRHKQQLLLDLLMVLTGLRPLVLLDYVVCTPADLQQLVQGCRALQGWPGAVLSLGGCCCVAHLPELLGSCRKRLQALQQDTGPDPAAAAAAAAAVPASTGPPWCQAEGAQCSTADLPAAAVHTSSSVAGRQQQEQQQQQQQQQQGAAPSVPAPLLLVHASGGWRYANRGERVALCQQLQVLLALLHQHLPQTATGHAAEAGAAGLIEEVTTAAAAAAPADGDGALSRQSQQAPLYLQPEEIEGDWQPAAAGRRRGRNSSKAGGSRPAEAAPAGHEAAHPLPGEANTTSTTGNHAQQPTLQQQQQQDQLQQQQRWVDIQLDGVQGLPVLPTLNGWLLEYPMIYLINSYEQAVAASKALSSSRLLLHSACLTLTQQLQRLLQPARAQSVAAAGSGLGEQQQHVLCSFSVPEELSRDAAVLQVAEQLLVAYRSRLHSGLQDGTKPLQGMASAAAGQLVAAAGCWQDIALQQRLAGPQAVCL